MSAPLHGADLLAHMEALLDAWRPRPGEAQPDIPMLTETPQEADEASALPPPTPAGMSREVLQAHLSEAAERVMVTLYRDLSTELNERMATEMRRLVDQGIHRATKTLRQQILVSVAESLTRSVDRAGHPPGPHGDELPPRPKPHSKPKI